MSTLKKLLQDQIKAAEDIKDEHGLHKALGYIIGEKFLNLLKASESSPEHAEHIQLFVDGIKHAFQPWEVNEYLDNVKRLRFSGHVMTDEEYELSKANGAFGEDDAVKGAQEVLHLERMKELLVLE